MRGRGFKAFLILKHPTVITVRYIYVTPEPSELYVYNNCIKNNMYNSELVVRERRPKLLVTWQELLAKGCQGVVVACCLTILGLAVTIFQRQGEKMTSRSSDVIIITLNATLTYPQTSRPVSHTDIFCVGDMMKIATDKDWLSIN